MRRGASLQAKPGIRRDRRAVAALEFAIVGPVMLVMMVGTIEFVSAFRIQTKLTVAAGQLAEMIAGSSAVSEGSSSGTGGSLADMCTAASYNLLPYSTSGLSGVVGSLTVTPATTIGLDWSTDRACPAPVTGGNSTQVSLLTSIADTPRSLFTLDGTSSSSGGKLTSGYSAISLQLTYVYSNILPFFLGPSITFTAVASARPRSNATIPCTYPSGGSTAPCQPVY